MESNVPEPPGGSSGNAQPPPRPRLTQAEAEAVAIVLQSIADRFGPHAMSAIDKAIDARRQELDARRRDLDAQLFTQRAESSERLRVESNNARRAFVLQMLTIAGVAAVAVIAGYAGQWPIAEKLAIGVIALGVGLKVGR